MNIIKIDDKKIICTLDYAGNFYMQLDDDIYDFSINHKDEIICEKYNITNQEDCIYEFCTIKPYFNNISLQGKAMQQMTKEGTEHNINLDDPDAVKKSYFKEDYDFNMYKKNSSEIEEPYFVIGFNNDTFDKKSIVHKRETINALYDLIVYSGTIECPNLLIKTSLENDTPLYRMCIYIGDALIKFRPIGSIDKYYKIIIDNNILNLKKLEPSKF